MEVYDVYEWSIKNFSSWNGFVHGQVIPGPENWYLPFGKIGLFPRGLTGREEHLVVRVSEIKQDLSGDISFVGSDGSLICTRTIKAKKCSDDMVSINGPDFEEVCTQLRTNEAEHKDQLTLRLRVKSRNGRELFMDTVLDVFDFTLKINPEFIIPNVSSTPRVLSVISFPDHFHSDLHFQVSKSYEGFFQPNEVVKFQLKPLMYTTSVWVLSCLSFLSSDDTLISREENEHVYLDHTPWTISDSLTTKQLKERGVSLTLRLKFCMKSVESCSHISLYPKSVSLLLNKRKSFTREKSFIFNNPVPVPLNQPEIAVNILSKDLKWLYQDQTHSDFTLRCGEVSFPTHKAVLSSRSPVFRSLLSTDMQEAESGSMDIIDLDASTLDLFLAFLYSGTLDDLQWEKAMDLYYAADKYQVPTLKRKCASVLSENLSILNVCKILWLADKHQDLELSKEAQNFIINHYSEVLRSDAWQNLVESEPLFVAKIVTHFAAEEYVKKPDA